MGPRHFDSMEAPGRSALLFSDDSAASDAALAAIEEVGLSCRILEGVETGHLALDGAFVDILVVEAGSTPPAHLSSLLLRLTAYAAETGTPVVASAPLDRIDLVAALLWPIGAQLLCQPSPEDRRAALEAALVSPVNAVLQDSAVARGRELEKLREDVERIARTVRTLTGDVGRSRDQASMSELEARDRAREVRQKIRARRLRDKFFDSKLFADPAWDILLDLYAAHLEGREVSVSSLCIAAATPPTTALRWIATMTDANMLTRRPDDRDKRRCMVSLSDAALDAIEQYFVAANALRYL